MAVGPCGFDSVLCSLWVVGGCGGPGSPTKLYAYTHQRSVPNLNDCMWCGVHNICGSRPFFAYTEGIKYSKIRHISYPTIIYLLGGCVLGLWCMPVESREETASDHNHRVN